MALWEPPSVYWESVGASPFKLKGSPQCCDQDKFGRYLQNDLLVTILLNVDIFDFHLVSHNLLFKDFHITFLSDLVICNDSIAFLYNMLDFAPTTSALYKRLPNSDTSLSTNFPSIHDKASKESLELTLDTPSCKPSTSKCLCLDDRTDWEWPSGRLDRPFITFTRVL